MRSVDMIIPLALVLQVHASELGAVAGNFNSESQESRDVKVDQLARNLFKRGPAVSSLDNVAVDNTTLGKPSNANLAISPTSIKAPVLQTHAFARSAYSKPLFQGKSMPGRLGFNKDMVSQVQHYICSQSPTRGSTIVKAQDGAQAEYDQMVDENRMITVDEQKIRYAGALAIFLAAVNDYVGMQAAGVYDYNKIAAAAAGAFLLFESGRRAF